MNQLRRIFLKKYKHKISQRESQKIDYIIPIIDYFLEHRKASVVRLVKDLKISRDSVERTIKFLVNKKKLLRLHNMVRYGEKLYSITSRKNFRLYGRALMWWKLLTSPSLKITNKSVKIAIKNWNRVQHKYRQPNDLFSIKFKVNKNEQKKLTTILWPKSFTVDDMHYNSASRLIQNYLGGNFCDECIKNGTLSRYQTDFVNQELICSKGHSIQILHSEFEMGKNLKSRKKNRLSYREIRKQSKKYIRSGGKRVLF